MYPDPHAPLDPPRPNRWWVWAALVLTAIAIPLVVIDNLPEDAEEESPITGAEVVVPSEVPSDRPAEGPAKGVSVVTSSTTSSTLPITTTTTTLPT